MAQSICDSTLKDVSPGSNGAWMETSIKRSEESLIQQNGEFTGTMVGITCADRVKHKHYADFDFFEYVADEDKNVE